MRTQTEADLEFIRDRETKTKRALEAEARRLAQEPFKTMVEVNHPEMINALKGFRPPRGAYILWELPCIRNAQDGKFVQSKKLGLMQLEHRPEQEHKFHYLQRKGGQPIHYGNFPTQNDPSAARRQLYGYHTGPNGVNSFDEMKALTEAAMRRNAGNNEKDLVIQRQEQTLEEYRRKLAEFEKESKAKDGGTSKSK